MECSFLGQLPRSGTQEHDDVSRALTVLAPSISVTARARPSSVHSPLRPIHSTRPLRRARVSCSELLRARDGWRRCRCRGSSRGDAHEEQEDDLRLPRRRRGWNRGCLAACFVGDAAAAAAPEVHLRQDPVRQEAWRKRWPEGSRRGREERGRVGGLLRCARARVVTLCLSF